MRSNTSSNRRHDGEPVRGVKPPAELTPLDEALDEMPAKEFLGLGLVFEELHESALEAGLEASERVLKELGLALGHSMRRGKCRDLSDVDKTFLLLVDDFYDRGQQ